MKMKYNHFLFASLVAICFIFAAVNANADEFKQDVRDHELTIAPGEIEIVSGETEVIDIKIRNTDEDKIFIKLEASGVPESWFSFKNEKQLFNIGPGAAENTKLAVHIPEGRIDEYNIKITARNPDTNVEVIKILKIETLPPKDKGMSGIPIFPLAEQPILLFLDIVHLVFNGIMNLIGL